MSVLLVPYKRWVKLCVGKTASMAVRGSGISYWNLSDFSVKICYIIKPRKPDVIIQGDIYKRCEIIDLAIPRKKEKDKKQKNYTRKSEETVKH